jgi:hypothetical protein
LDTTLKGERTALVKQTAYIDQLHNSTATMSYPVIDNPSDYRFKPKAGDHVAIAG